MLQWMGGSRRKVTASRKSTQNRQKQYFEQRKRLLQASGLENYGDGRHKRAQCHEKPQSLDIASMMNLARLAEECSSGHAENGLNDSELNSCPILPSATIPANKAICGELDEAKCGSTCYSTKMISPKKSALNTANEFSGAAGPDNEPPTYRSSSNTNSDKQAEWKMPCEKQLSVFDLLGDEVVHDSSKGTSTNEAHVAFSVEGLGKMGMETPAHSPKKSYRVFFNGGFSPPKDAKRLRSSKRRHKCLTKSFDIEMVRVVLMAHLSHVNVEFDVISEVVTVLPAQSDDMIHDISLSLSDSSPEFASNSREVTGHSKIAKCSPLGSMQLDACDSSMEEFIEEKHDHTWDDEDFLNVRKHGLAWKSQPFSVDRYSSYFALADEICDDSYDDSILLERRNARKVFTKRNKISVDSPASSFKHLPSEEDYNFGMGRYTSDLGSWDCMGELMNEPSWSFTGSEDARDSMSLLSEESCTSSAVKDKQTKNSFSNLTKIKSSNNNHLCELQSTSKKNMKNLYAAKVASASLGGFHRERNYNRTANFEREPSLKWSREAHYSRELSAVQETSEPLKRSPLKDKHMSFDEDSILSPRHGAMGTDITSMDCKIWSEENICGLFPSPKVYPNVESCSNKSKSKSTCPFDCAPFGSFFPEKDVLKRPVALTHSSECQPSYPCCLADCKDELRIRLTESGKVTKGPEKEISLLKSDLSSEKGKALDVVDINDSCSGDEEEVKEETPEFIENPKMEKNLDCVEANLTSLKEIPAKLESLIQKQYDLDSIIQLQLSNSNTDVNKENGEPERTRFGSKVDSSADQSYKVMLESYVLQLLCVQKVLKESSQQDTVKKV